MARLRRLATGVAPLLLVAGIALLKRPQPQTTASQAPSSQPGQSAAAGQPDRGRSAESPREIPARGWKDILLRTWSEFNEDNIPMISAGVTFYALLALFPGIAAVVSLYGLFADLGDVQQQLARLSVILPSGAIEVVGDQMKRIAAAHSGGLSLAFIAGLGASLWSANGAVKALMIGLNVAYEEKERRSFLRKTLISFSFTIGALAFGMLAIAAIALGPAVEAFAGRTAAMTVEVVTWPILLVVLGIGLSLLYRYGPSREPVRLRWISWGSAVAVISWLAMSALFSVFVAHFGHFNRTYGSLGAVVGFMTWLYLSTIVVLAGAELNAETEHQTAADTTDGAPRPMGGRGARMADTVGAAHASGA